MDKTLVYRERINRVLDFIEAGLSGPITLDELARLACFSKYHFHRIFYSFTGEPLYQYINRLRVERAAALLLNQSRTITDIAFDCGFNDSATFARAFKKHFKISALEWKKKKNSNNDQDGRPKPLYDLKQKIKNNPFIAPLAVKEQQLPAMTLAYVRHTGAFAGNGKLFYTLYQKLIHWAESRGLGRADLQSIVIYHDPLGITAEDKLKISMGIAIAPDTIVRGEVGKLTINKGRYLLARFELKNDEYGRAWTGVYRHVLPQRALQPRDGYCYESYAPDCYDQEKGTTTVDICVPVKGL